MEGWNECDTQRKTTTLTQSRTAERETGQGSAGTKERHLERRKGRKGGGKEERKIRRKSDQ
jgi:hypothetical protein